MPIYEYVCMSCESHFEELVRVDETPPCPDCGSDKANRQFSTFAAHGLSKPQSARRRRLRVAAAVVGAVAAAIEGLTNEAALAALRDAVATCTRCPLSATRTQTVFGSGSPTADLMFVGEAPGFHEDKQGVPFVGAAGQLLGKLLAGIGLTRDDVFVANVLKCRPPGNRDPAARGDRLLREPPLPPDRADPAEGDRTLGNFATKLLSGKPDGITKVHGREQEVVLGGTRVLLFPIFHPAAALYTPRMLDVLQADFQRLPELLGRVAGLRSFRPLYPLPSRPPSPPPILYRCSSASDPSDAPPILTGVARNPARPCRGLPGACRCCDVGVLGARLRSADRAQGQEREAARGDERLGDGHALRLPRAAAPSPSTSTSSR